MRDDTPTFAAEEARHAAHLPEWRDLPGPDELDHTPSSVPTDPRVEAWLRESQRIIAGLGGAS